MMVTLSVEREYVRVAASRSLYLQKMRERETDRQTDRQTETEKKKKNNNNKTATTTTNPSQKGHWITV